MKIKKIQKLSPQPNIYTFFRDLSLCFFFLFLLFDFNDTKIIISSSHHHNNI
jgi:hypothetical protein